MGCRWLCCPGTHSVCSVHVLTACCVVRLCTVPRRCTTFRALFPCLQPLLLSSVLLHQGGLRFDKMWFLGAVLLTAGVAGRMAGRLCVP